MSKLIMACLAVFTASTAFAQTADVLNPDVDQARIGSTICVSGWTATVRPPTSYTNRVKRQEMEAAGIPWSQSGTLELDHAVPLTLGGHPRNPKNLRLQPWNGPAGAHAKDHLEVHLNRLVCKGKMTLKAAQKCIWADWQSCAQRVSR